MQGVRTMYFYALAQGTDSGDPVTLHHEKKFSKKEFLEMFNEALDELDTHPAPSDVGDYLCRAYGFQEIEIETGVVCYCAPFRKLDDSDIIEDRTYMDATTGTLKYN